MLREPLALARDWSIILLALQAFIISLLVLLLLWKAAGFLGRVVRGAGPFLATVEARVCAVLAVIRRVVVALQAPFLWLDSMAVTLRVGAARLRRGSLKGR